MAQKDDREDTNKVTMPQEDKVMLKVYYDAACPLCRNERKRYESWQKAAKGVEWLDVNTHHKYLIAHNVVPREAVLSLHLEDASGQFHNGIDAYVILMRRVTHLKPLAWLIGLPIIKPMLTRIYERMVRRRLAKDGRI